MENFYINVGDKLLTKNGSSILTYDWEPLIPGTQPKYPGYLEPGTLPYNPYPNSAYPNYIFSSSFPTIINISFIKLSSGTLIKIDDIFAIKKIDEDKWEILFKNIYLPVSFIINKKDYDELVKYLDYIKV